MIKKADIVLAAVLLIIGLGSPFLLRSNSADDSFAVITVDNEILGSYPLSKDRTLILTEGGLKEASGPAGSLHTQSGEEILNIIVIENGEVRVKSANCRGNDCVKMGAISTEGQFIACLPHKMLITISGGDDAPDVIIN